MKMDIFLVQMQIKKKQSFYMYTYEILFMGMKMKSISFPLLFLIKYILITQEKIIQSVGYLCMHSFPSLFYFYQQLDLFNGYNKITCFFIPSFSPSNTSSPHEVCCTVHIL